MWWARTDSGLARRTSILDAVEGQRAEAYRRAADRRRFIIGCVVSRLVLAAWLDLPPERVPLDRTCHRCGAAHGRPRLSSGEIAFSVSHAGDLAVVAFARDAEVGVDVEELSKVGHPDALLPTVLAPQELADLRRHPETGRAFLSYWTRKEAVVKATGDGLSAGLTGVVVSPPDEPARLISYAGRPDLPATTTMVDLVSSAGLSATLALIGDATGWQVSELDAGLL